MSLGFRWTFFLVILAALSALGCDDGTHAEGDEEAAVRTKTRLVLVGEACSDDADCDDPCHTGVSCDVGGTNLCVGTPVMDGTACNTNNNVCDGQTCGGGVCGNGTPAPLVCNDNVACTTDSCDPTNGCQHVPNHSTCNDSNACTTDTCHLTLGCQNVDNVTPTCDDGEACTDDDCNPSNGNCRNIPNNSNSCSDGIDCTTDSCSGGSCNSVANNAACNDSVSCTVDVCDLTLGCQNTPANNLCGDGVACTNDICDTTLGCQNVPVNSNCSDGISCTNDICDPTSGCSNVADNSNCNDGIACSTDVCDPTLDCINTPVHTACSDGVACTNDVCDLTLGCQNTPVNSNCSDGVACTVDICDPVTNCSNTPSNALCDDGNECTTNTCNATLGCQVANVTGPCSDDGIACTVDQCQAGVCAHTADNSLCPDPNPSDCVGRTCNAAVGCQNINLTTNNPNPTTSYCDDNVGCTQFEYCQAGVCRGRPNDNNCPNGACFIGICDSSLDCQPRYDTLAGTVCRPEAPGTVCDVAETCPVPSDPNYGTPAGQACPPDAFLPSTEVCSAASCDSGVQMNQALCPGDSAVCTVPSPIDCNGYACTTDTVSVCRGQCTNSTHCLSTHYCDTTLGQCLPRINPGQPCTSNGQCGQGDFCVDGVCCNATCSGQCEACDEPGFEGQCVTISGNPHPGQAPGVLRPACTSDGSSCGGTCAGTSPTACTFPLTGTVCAPAACDPAENEAVEASLCNGAGTCVSPAPSSCSPFVCSGSVCRGDCTQDSHCAGNQQCNGGVCVNPFSNGQECTVASQCQSGNCVDGVCCNSACTGQCEACNVAGSRGTCSAATGAPVGSRPSCAGSGTCRGSCNGTVRTACTFPSTDVSCRGAACNDSTATLGAYCNGAGNCPAAQTVECSDGCSGPICADGECLLNSECPSGEVCRAAVCVPADPIGTACALNSDCASGFCVDGVCCDGACSGQCEACDVSGSIGSCSAVSAGDRPHGARPPCASDGSECGGTCDGSDRTSCDYPTGAECRDGSCSDGVATVAAVCNGTGLCPILQQQDCGMVSCDSTNSLCDGPCATDPDACNTGQYCSAGICVDLVENGSTCAADSQCESGFCVDGYCCNSGCDSQCAACDVPGSEGLCSPVTGAAHGARPACMGGGTCGAQCNGEDTTQCSYPQADVVCGAPTCQSGVETAQAFCDGTGSCAQGEATACSSLVCNGTQCADACETNEDCLGDLICENNACIVDPLINAVDKGSCGCRIPGDSPRGGGAPWLLLLPLGLIVTRRRSTHSAVKGASHR